MLEGLGESGVLPTTRPSSDDLAWRRRFLGNLVFPGFSIHHELELMVEAGVSPMDALLAATRMPARMLGQEQVFGTLTPGRRADLLVLGADPLIDIRNTRTLEVVIQNGRVLDRDSLLRTR